MSNTPSVGRVVHYTLSSYDAQQINKRRQDAQRNMALHIDTATGAVVHVGNTVAAGDVFPLVITRVWGSAVNGQVLLDGNDTFWATSVVEGEGERHYRWPERV